MKLFSVGVKLFLEDRQANRHEKFNNLFFFYLRTPLKMDLKTKGMGTRSTLICLRIGNMQMKFLVP